MGWESFDSWSLCDFASEPNCSQHIDPGWSRIRFNDSTGRSDTIRPSPLSLYLFSSVHLSISLIKKTVKPRVVNIQGPNHDATPKRRTFDHHEDQSILRRLEISSAIQKALDLFESQKVKNSPRFLKNFTSLRCLSFFFGNGCGASGKSDPFSAPLLLMHFIHAWRTD